MYLTITFFPSRTWNKDYGIITNKTALPITGFNYSSIYLDSQATYSVGRLKCSGRKRFQDEGKSCASLKSVWIL